MAPAGVPAAPLADGTSPAQQEAARILGVGERVGVTADVGVWVPRLTGTARVGTGGTTFQLNEQLAVGASAPGAAGEIAVWWQRWRFGLVGFETSYDGKQVANRGGTFGTTAISVGDRLAGDYSAWMFGAEVGYVVWRPFADEPWPWSDAGANRAQATAMMGKNGRPLFDVQVLALAGALAFGYEQNLENLSAGGSSGYDKTIGALYGGGGLEMKLGMDDRVPVLQDIRIYCYLGLGPSLPDADIVWMIRVGFAAMLDENVGVEFGYRLFDFNLQTGPSEVDAGLRGLFGGISVKF